MMMKNPILMTTMNNYFVKCYYECNYFCSINVHFDDASLGGK